MNIGCEGARLITNDILIIIEYRGGNKEECYVSDYEIVSGCLLLKQRFEGTRYIPLDLIKEWKVW